MNLLQQLHDVLAQAATKLEDTGHSAYLETAQKVQNKVDEITPLLEADAQEAEAKAIEFIHTLFGGEPVAH